MRRMTGSEVASTHEVSTKPRKHDIPDDNFSKRL